MLRGDWIKKKLGRSSDAIVASPPDEVKSTPAVSGDIADYAKNRAALLSSRPTQVNPFATEEEEDESPSTNPFMTKTYNDLAAQEEDDAIQSLKLQTRQTQQASLESTRRSKQRLLQTEESAHDTLVNLDQQGEQLRKAAYGVDNINFKAEEAAYHYHELKRLHKFLPFSWKSEKRKKAAYKNIEAQRKAEQARHDEIVAYQARKAMMEDMHAASKTEEQDDARAAFYAQQEKHRAGTGQKSTLSEEESIQAEMDDNLDDISAMVRRLNAAAMDMNRQLGEQSECIDRIGAGTEKAGSKVHMLNSKIQKYT